MHSMRYPPPSGQRLADHTIDVGVHSTEFGRALGDHATLALGVGHDVGDDRTDVPGEAVVGGDAGLPQLCRYPIHRIDAVFVERTHEQSVLVTEGAVQAALAEPGSGGQVVDGRRGVTATPEPVTGSRHHRVLIELAWAWHEISVRRSGINSPDDDLSPVMAIHPPRRHA